MWSHMYIYITDKKINENKELGRKTCFAQLPGLSALNRRYHASLTLAAILAIRPGWNPIGPIHQKSNIFQHFLGKMKANLMEIGH